MKIWTLVVDVDLDTGLVDDLVDGLAAAADDVADLVGVDGEGHDLGRPFAQFRTRTGKDGEHLVEDEESALTRLFERLGQDLFVDALDLDVHLDGGDAFGGACHLEVHVAEEVLKTLNVAENSHSVVVGVLDETHRNARDGRLDGHALRP